MNKLYFYVFQYIYITFVLRRNKLYILVCFPFTRVLRIKVYDFDLYSFMTNLCLQCKSHDRYINISNNYYFIFNSLWDIYLY